MILIEFSQNSFTKLFFAPTGAQLPRSQDVVQPRDWDHEDVSIEEQRRYKRTETEIDCLLLVNTVFSLVPLWYTGQSRIKSI